MKTKTLTFHCAYNYGAMLQTYALQQTLKKIDIENEVIDFRPEKLRENYSVTIYKKNKNIIKNLISLLTYKVRKNRKILFENFLREEIKLSSRTYFSYEELKEDIVEKDVYIVGSDQVWNPEVIYSPAYFLNFEEKEIFKIAYAASFGQDKILEKYYPTIKESLENFDNISVRENSGVELVKKIASREATKVLDPVFLLSKKEWDKLGKEKSDILNSKLEKDYILIYSLENNSLLLEIAEKIKKITGKQIVILHSDYTIRTKLKICLSKNINIVEAGPKEFINLFSNADYILTNSFHGTAFSIIYNKKFVVLPHTTRNTRMESLLGELGLLNKFIDETILKLSDEELEKKFYNYGTDIEKILEKKIKMSKEFLQKALFDNKEKEYE